MHQQRISPHQTPVRRERSWVFSRLAACVCRQLLVINGQPASGALNDSVVPRMQMRSVDIRTVPRTAVIRSNASRV